MTSLDVSTIILGFTGSIGSGCTYISNYLPKVAEEIKYKYFKLSDVIRDHHKDSNNNISTSQMQDAGNLLRKNNEPGYLVFVLLNKIKNDPNIQKYDAIIIDGIKNVGEIQSLRQFPFFFLFSVHSNYTIRCDRSIGVGKKFVGEEQFTTADDRDRLEKDNIYGQQVKKCNYLSDITILNNKKIPIVDNEQKKKFIGNIYNKYVKLIENLQSDNPSPASSPTVDELFMTNAYSLSRMSSCLKRKVGAVIVQTINANNGSGINRGKISSFPIMVSSGYNEVPLGSYKCAYHPDFEKCYRDYLQEEHAKKIKYCPNCGVKLNVKTFCPHCEKEKEGYIKYCKEYQKEIEDEFKCSNCNSRIFQEYLPGAKETPGKLLDMCRALHAEENALLNLMNKGRLCNGDLTIYVTTQPCNLCANKIVAAGIDRVVFDEPYPIKESEDILKEGNIKVNRFEGIKSTAYFKLYY